MTQKESGLAAEIAGIKGGAAVTWRTLSFGLPGGLGRFFSPAVSAPTDINPGSAALVLQDLAASHIQNHVSAFLPEDLTLHRGEVPVQDVNAASKEVEPENGVPEHSAMDMSVAWAVSEDITVCPVVRNLLDESHTEGGAFDSRTEIPRAIYWKFVWNS